MCVYHEYRKHRPNDVVRNRVTAHLKRQGYSGTIEIHIGYKVADLINHLESKFTDDMSWEAFIDGEIEIDHIKPCSSFDLTDIRQLRECWSLSNLQPLWADENRVKSNHFASGF